jgi:hypothetical protein
VMNDFDDRKGTNDVHGEKRMSTTIAPDQIDTSLSQTRTFLNVEIKALREIAERTNDENPLLIMDFLENQTDDSSLFFEIALSISAYFAAAEGLSQEQWMQQILSRHAAV